MDAVHEPKINSKICSFPRSWWPNPITFVHYLNVFDGNPVGTWFENTGIITVLTVIGATTSSSLVAYGFSCGRRAPGKNVLFWVLLSTMMIPGIVVLLPQYIMFRIETGQTRSCP